MTHNRRLDMRTRKELLLYIIIHIVLRSRFPATRTLDNARSGVPRLHSPRECAKLSVARTSIITRGERGQVRVRSVRAAFPGRLATMCMHVYSFLFCVL